MHRSQGYIYAWSESSRLCSSGRARSRSGRSALIRVGFADFAYPESRVVSMLNVYRVRRSSASVAGDHGQEQSLGPGQPSSSLSGFTAACHRGEAPAESSAGGRPSGGATAPTSGARRAEAASEEAIQQMLAPWKGDLDGMVERRYVRMLVAFSESPRTRTRRTATRCSGFLDPSKWYARVRANSTVSRLRSSTSRVPVGAGQVLALVVDTTRRPFVVKNPVYGQQGGGAT